MEKGIAVEMAAERSDRMVAGCTEKLNVQSIEKCQTAVRVFEGSGWKRTGRSESRASNPVQTSEGERVSASWHVQELLVSQHPSHGAGGGLAEDGEGSQQQGASPCFPHPLD